MGKEKTPRDRRGDAEHGYRVLIEEAADGLLVSDDRGQLLEVNRSICTLLGYAREELLRLDLRSLTPEDHLVAVPSLLEALGSGRIVRAEHCLQRHDGSLVPVELSARRQSDGRIQSWIRDISERKQLERGERDTNEEIASMLDGISDAFFALDREWRFTYLNAQTEKFLEKVGATRQQILGKNIWAEFRVDSPQAGPGPMEKAMSEGVPVEFESFYAPMDTWFGIRVYPTENGLSVYCRDITQRKHAEAALETRTTQLQAVTEATTAFLQHGDWRLASAFLLDSALVQAESASGILGAVLDGPAIRVLARRAAGSEPEPVEAPVEPTYGVLSDPTSPLLEAVASGEPVHKSRVRIDSTLLGLPPGRSVRSCLALPLLRGTDVVGVIGLFDRKGGFSGSEPRQLEVLAEAAAALCDGYRRQDQFLSLGHQAVRSQRMESIGRLAGGIAHDFNNLMATITGQSELLLNERGEDEGLRARIIEIQAAAQRAAFLTRQLLVFSGQQILQQRSLDLNALLGEMQETLGATLAENVELSLSLEPALGLITADLDQMRQVITSLVMNANEAMTSGGRIGLETQNVAPGGAREPSQPDIEPGAYVLLSVSDNGIGMDAATRTRIFEPFFTTKESGRGVGLGLSTVYGIVTQSGGHMHVTSAPGEGSTFEIFFPRNERTSQPVSEADAEDAPAGMQTVLLVEDEEAVRSVVREILEMQGFEVLQAANGQEALRVGSSHAGPIALLLTDIEMPRMGGRELSAALRRSRPETRVLYMSGYAASLQTGGLEPDAGFIQKPFTVKALVTKLNEILVSRS